jgi:addiction module HigA family antidote
MKNPAHPGDFIRTEIIEPAGLTVTATAALQVSRPALSSLLNGRASLSGDMGLRLEKAFGVKMDTLLRMQASYDIARTRKRETKSVYAGFRRWKRGFDAILWDKTYGESPVFPELFPSTLLRRKASSCQLMGAQLSKIAKGAAASVVAVPVNKLKGAPAPARFND